MRRAAVTVVLFSLPLWAAGGDVYRSLDAQGHVQYSDTPTPGAELVHVVGGHVAAEASHQSDLNKRTEQVGQQLSGDSAQRAVTNDVQQAHSEQCKKAQETYQQSIQARRIYKTGQDGEREYLTDADADQVRLNNRLEMESACKDSQ